MSMLRRFSLPLLTLVACAPAPAPLPQVAVERLAPEAAAPPAPQPPSPCEGRREPYLTASEVELTCEDEFRNCQGTSVIGFHNCSGVQAQLLRLDLSDGDYVTTLEPREKWVAPGASWTIERPYRHARRFQVKATARAGGKRISLAPVTLTIVNPAREAAMAACEACNGNWGTRGMMATEGCNCTMPDAGKPCDDGNDCQGACLFDHFELVQPGFKRCHPDGSCSVQLATGRAVGTCSSQQSIFGCHARISEGASTEPPVLLPSRAPMICAD
jgi:hypothetical protein